MFFGRRHTKAITARNKREAGVALRRWIDQLGVIPPNALDATIDRLAAAWLRVVKGSRSPATFERYRSTLERWVPPRWGVFEVGKLPVAAFEAWLAELGTPGPACIGPYGHHQHVQLGRRGWLHHR
jgi:hypothetical protein